MKLIGDEMLNSGIVDGPGISDTSFQFNRLTVNSISEVNLETVDKNVLISVIDDGEIYYYNNINDEWISWSLDFVKRNKITFNSSNTQNQFNYIHFLSDPDRNLEVSNSILDQLTSENNFVIDWWMYQYSTNINGCLMYGGDTTSLNPILNKELCITTSGDIIDPETLLLISNPSNDGYLNVLYPPLKSNIKINNGLWHHFALVTQNEKIQLVIDSEVHDETTFDNISSINNLLFGFGYGDGIESYVGKIRITKGTNLGWFGGGFDLPDNDYIIDVNTDFLMDSTSLVDTTGNYSVIVNGGSLNIYQENHYVYLQPSITGSFLDIDLPNDTNIYLVSDIKNSSTIISTNNSFFLIPLNNDKTCGLFGKLFSDVNTSGFNLINKSNDWFFVKYENYSPRIFEYTHDPYVVQEFTVKDNSFINVVPGGTLFSLNGETLNVSESGYGDHQRNSYIHLGNTGSLLFDDGNSNIGFDVGQTYEINIICRIWQSGYDGSTWLQGGSLKCPAIGVASNHRIYWNFYRLNRAGDGIYYITLQQCKFNYTTNYSNIYLHWQLKYRRWEDGLNRNESIHISIKRLDNNNYIVNDGPINFSYSNTDPDGPWWDTLTPFTELNGGFAGNNHIYNIWTRIF